MSDDAERATLLAEILANPDDDAPRLVFADWLTQRGDPRGELIAIQCAIAAGKGDPRTLGERERELLAAHADEWTRHAITLGRCTLRRGFIEVIQTSASRFAAEGAVHLERDPIRTLILQRGHNPGFRELATAPHLGRIRRLELERWLTDATDLDATQQLLRSPHLATLRELTLQIKVDDDADGVPSWPLATPLFEGVELPALEQLALHIEALDRDYEPDPGIFRVLASAKLPALRTLSIDPLVEVERLAAAFPAARIRRLVL